MWGRLWVRELMIKQLKEGLIDLGFGDEDYLGLTDLQVAAVGWLAQAALFARLAAKFGERRVMQINSETLLATPAKAIGAVAAHFRLALVGGQIREIVGGPAFTRNSKDGSVYSAAARTVDNRAAEALHRDEIEKVVVWAQSVAKNAKNAA